MYRILLFCGDMNINSILQGTVYYFWEFYFLIQSLLYVRQIQTIYLPKTAPTHGQWGQKFKLVTSQTCHFYGIPVFKSTILSRLWITIHFLKGLCMNTMIKLVKHKRRSLRTRTLQGSHESWSRGLCPYTRIWHVHCRRGWSKWRWTVASPVWFKDDTKMRPSTSLTKPQIPLSNDL